MSPRSLPKAIMLPVKATPPIMPEADAATVNWAGSASIKFPLRASSRAAPAARADAPPPKPLKMATTWGMAVMGAR